MKMNHVIEKSTELIQKSKVAYLGSIDSKDFPNIKAMLNLKNEGLKKIWFSTNTSSRRVSVLKKNPKACVYYADTENFMGLMLTGTLEVCQDEESRKKVWFDGAERYYTEGINDPDYSVLCFTAQKGNFYHKQSNIDFDIES